MKQLTKSDLKKVRPAKQSKRKNMSGTYTAKYRQMTVDKTLPIMPRSVYESEKSGSNRMVFTLVQRHIKLHSWIFVKTFATNGSGNPATKYYGANKVALRSIILGYLDGLDENDPIDFKAIERAIVDYSLVHPRSIIIGQRDGYETIYLDGEWPEHVVMSSPNQPPIVVFRSAHKANEAIG